MPERSIPAAESVNTGRRPFVALAAVTAVALLVPVASASAGVSVNAFLDEPLSLTVGQSNVGPDLTLTNTNDGVNAGQSDTVTLLELAPSCASPLPTGLSVCPSPDPGVFALAPSATGIGPACQGTTFTVGPPNMSGAVTFTPSTPIVLTQPAQNGFCTLLFSFSVRKLPFDTAPGLPGAQTRANVRVTVTTPTAAGFGVSSREVTVFPGTPTLTGSATNATLGQPIRDNATVSGGGVSPTGAVSFFLYGPDNNTCTGVPLFSSSRPLGAGGTATSADYTPAALGSYRWTAAYSGDANYNAVGPTACSAPGQTSVISQPAPPAPDAAATATTGGGSPVTGTAPVPAAKFSLAGKPKLGKDGSATFSLNAPGAGDVGASGTANIANAAKLKKVCGGTTMASKASKISLKVKPNGTGRKQLRRKGRLRTTVKITFKPAAGGPSTTVSQTVTLRLKR